MHNEQIESGLPAAGTVTRARSAVTRWSRRRTLLAVGSAVVGIGLITFGAVTSGSGGPSAVAAGPVTTYADRVESPAGADSPGAEHSSAEAPGDKDADAGERGEADPVAPESPVRRPGAAVPDASPSTPATGTPGAGTPGAAGPGTPTPGTTDPGSEDPGSETPGASGPGTSDPGAGTPGPGTGTPGTSTPGTSTPGTPAPGGGATPTTPAAPQPLAFAGLQKNETLTLLGIRVLASYTLSITGQPGATASVTYGGRGAGSVTFDGSGRASITFGRALLDLGLSDPLIRVAYSDGTAGSAIEASRNAL